MLIALCSFGLKAGVELNVLNFSQFGLEKGLKDVIKLHSTHAKVFKLTLMKSEILV